MNNKYSTRYLIVLFMVNAAGMILKVTAASCLG